MIKNNIAQKYPKPYNWINASIQKSSEKLAGSRFFKPIPNFFGISPKDASISLGENILFHKLMSPIIFPLQVYVVIKLYQTDHGPHHMISDFKHIIDYTEISEHDLASEDETMN